MSSLAFLTLSYRFAVNINNSLKIHKPLTAKLFMIACYQTHLTHFLSRIFTSELQFYNQAIDILVKFCNYSVIKQILLTDVCLELPHWVIKVQLWSIQIIKKKGEKSQFVILSSAANSLNR